jgi:membrane associated rhomboid family serine protease
MMRVDFDGVTRSGRQGAAGAKRKRPMGVWDRDYSKSGYERRVGGIGWRAHLPPRGALLLVVLHVLAFFVLRVLQHDRGDAAVLMFRLRNDALHPAGILLHPFGNLSLWTLLLVVYAIWKLGGHLEARFGTARLWGTYLAGTLIAGVVFVGFAQLSGAHASHALVLPVGALAAWVLGAWQRLGDEMVSIFGKLTTTAKATALGAAIVAGLVFLFNGPGATGWLIAAAAGSLGWPIVSLAGRLGRAMTTGRPARRGRAVNPAPRTESPESVAADAVLDELLDKISREGLEALDPAERARLEAARRAKLRRNR